MTWIIAKEIKAEWSHAGSGGRDVLLCDHNESPNFWRFSSPKLKGRGHMTSPWHHWSALLIMFWVKIHVLQLFMFNISAITCFKFQYKRKLFYSHSFIYLWIAIKDDRLQKMSRFLFMSIFWSNKEKPVIGGAFKSICEFSLVFTDIFMFFIDADNY